MAALIEFPPLVLPPEAERLRLEVRDFLAAELTPELKRTSFSREFSRKVGERGWIGMTWPRQYGGHERSAIERYVVMEEMLAAGAPTACHFVADRQSGPLILRFGTEEQRQRLLPKMARGEYCFAIGLSEPDAGSDLASVRTRAVKVDGGWRVNGAKIWTSNAHRADYMILFCRTAPKTDNRHAGFSQFLIDMTAPGVSTRPILNMGQEHTFNQVFFDDYFVPDAMLLGTVDGAWQQVISELAFERSGPERFLNSLRLFIEFVRAVGPTPSEAEQALIGRITSRLWMLRRMSISVSGMLEEGKTPNVEAALVKDQGTSFEQESTEAMRYLLPSVAHADGAGESYFEALEKALLFMPRVTIQGGSREVLRGIIARGLGLR